MNCHNHAKCASFNSKHLESRYLMSGIQGNMFHSEPFVGHRCTPAARKRAFANSTEKKQRPDDGREAKTILFVGGNVVHGG